MTEDEKTETNVVSFKTRSSKEEKEKQEPLNMDDEKQKAIDVAIEALSESDTFKGFMLFLLPYDKGMSDTIIGGTLELEKAIGAMEYAKHRILTDYVRLDEQLDAVLVEDNEQTD